MDKCGHCAYWANNSFTGTSSCRLTKRDDVGYFAPSCEHFERREQPTKTKETMETTETTNTAPQTKVCKICGRELPLDSFPKHPRTKDGHTTICADCFRAKNAASIQKAIDARRKEGPSILDALIDKLHVCKLGILDAVGEPYDKLLESRIANVDYIAQQCAEDIEKDIKERKLRLIVDKRDLTDYTDRELYDELRRRGWTGTLTRTETLGSEY